MRLPNGTILMHTDSDGVRHAYDPVYAREYYLRTRRLRGRRRGSAVETIGAANRSAAAAARAMGAVRTSAAIARNASVRRNARQLAAVTARVQSIQKKLTELNRLLKEKIAAAKEAEREAREPKTAAERARAARDSRKYRDRNQQRIRNQRQAKAARDRAEGRRSVSIESLRTQIENVKRKLSEAVAQQKALSRG